MSPLSLLLTDEFALGIGVVNSPAKLRRALLLCPIVTQVKSALANGIISEATIERFADELMPDFVRGEHFPHELPLAAVAVTLEGRQTRFAEDYLLDLARLHKRVEMDLAPRVAGLCLKYRSQAPRALVRQARNAEPRIVMAREGVYQFLAYSLIRSKASVRKIGN